ncbi:hypothetical protein ALC62_08022 [Cyphomyrmex costatus]|uniref:Uncharacterized protein n=1 Tax=Cyphomyrmex costatus TaxID=456900 RepID=A0A195CKC4_9HYME|nr:hypothetical protein ALC62_08022 [Cyphomyrmex costatus]
MAAKIIVVGALLFPEACFISVFGNVRSRGAFLVSFALALERRREGKNEIGKVCEISVCVPTHVIPAESLQRSAPQPEEKALSSVKGHPGFRGGIEPRMSRNHPNGQCKQGKFKRTKPRESIRRTKVQGSKRRVCMPQLVKSYESLRKSRETFANPSITFVRESKGFNKIASVTRSPTTIVHEKEEEEANRKCSRKIKEEEGEEILFQNRELCKIFILTITLRALFAFLVLIGNIAAKRSAINGTDSRHEPTPILSSSPPPLPLCPPHGSSLPAPPCALYLCLALGVEPEPTHPHDCPGVPSLFHPPSPLPSFTYHPLLALSVPSRDVDRPLEPPRKSHTAEAARAGETRVLALFQDPSPQLHPPSPSFIADFSLLLASNKTEGQG